MEFATSLFIALGLAMDAFAVSLGVATTGQAHDPRARFRLAFHFGIFQTGMTLLGYLAGSTIANLINGIDHWVAFILLGYVGINMIRSGFNPDAESYQSNPSRGRTLMVLCVATSLDAMAVGLSMAMLKSPVIFPSLVIGVVASGLSTFGLFAGSKLGEAFGKRMEILGGLILLGIGIRILVTHLA
jgi:manganese efflux pump family protein